MKRTNIIYWISTVLLTLNVAMAGVMYFTNPDIVAGFVHLGFPDYTVPQFVMARSRHTAHRAKRIVSRAFTTSKSSPALGLS